MISIIALDHLLTSVAGLVADNSTTNPTADFQCVTTLRYVASANPRVWVDVRLYRSEQGPIAHMLGKVGFCFYAPTLQYALRQRLQAALTSAASRGAAEVPLSSSALDCGGLTLSTVVMRVRACLSVSSCVTSTDPFLRAISTCQIRS